MHGNGNGLPPVIKHKGKSKILKPLGDQIAHSRSLASPMMSDSGSFSTCEMSHVEPVEIEWQYIDIDTRIFNLGYNLQTKGFCLNLVSAEHFAGS